MASKSSETTVVKPPRKRRAPRKTARKPAVNGAGTVTTTQAQLDAHERECAARYAAVLEKLGILDKKMWRFEGYLIFGVIAIIIAQFVKYVV
jgi:hypothetical protein